MKTFMAGFQILCKYDPDGDMCAEHDEVYVSGPEPDNMTQQEREIMKTNGWTWDASNDSWHKFV